MFKQDFKYYKSKNPHPNLTHVLDFEKSSELLEKGVIKQLNKIEDTALNFGLKKPEEWEIFEINSNPGLIYIRNPFTSDGQRYWIKQCLKEYTKKPHQLNIDNLNIIPEGKDWWDVAQIDKKIQEKLRWATLGYHHNWDTKVYSESNKSEFPKDLKQMCEYVAHKLGFAQFAAEASIVNFYHLDSTLSGHTDHSEQNLEAPLFSFSFGQTAIFLLGGRTIEEKPISMFLRSGDVVVMSKESRLCYHGVPRIIKEDIDIWNNEEHSNLSNDFISIKKSDWSLFSNYIEHSRININVRQVLDTNKSSLNS